jgi:thiamine biosynthesis protein ThiS
MTLQISVDGLPEVVADNATVIDVLRQRGEPAEHIIVEINGSFVHPDTYTTKRLREGDRIEVVYPAFGG